VEIAELVFSSIKRVMSGELLSKMLAAQKVEAGLKVVLYKQFTILYNDDDIYIEPS
jgi:hypothetical protein